MIIFRAAPCAKRVNRIVNISELPVLRRNETQRPLISCKTAQTAHGKHAGIERAHQRERTQLLDDALSGYWFRERDWRTGYAAHYHHHHSCRRGACAVAHQQVYSDAEPDQVDSEWPGGHCSGVVAGEPVWAVRPPSDDPRREVTPCAAETVADLPANVRQQGNAASLCRQEI